MAAGGAAHIGEIRGGGKLIRPETALRLYDTADVTYAGGNGMHVALMALRPEDNSAVVVARNAGAPAALAEVSRALERGRADHDAGRLHGHTLGRRDVGGRRSSPLHARGSAP